MITLIVLAVFVGIGIFLLFSYYNETLGFIIIVMFGFCLLTHVGVWGLTSYRYELFVAKKNAFEQTLKDARENNNKYEIATIVRDISYWNIYLAEAKYDNKTIFFDQYIDDRIELLDPIK